LIKIALTLTISLFLNSAYAAEQYYIKLDNSFNNNIIIADEKEKELSGYVLSKINP